ncbi:pneumococcal-type histidine triad protein, partial [Streptococcus pneumoniae]|uniref:pneumococcal-type histidine triad protein n=1 Tax=Streptococcus pneumoniae TaxID=1313 RepID=UPI001885A63B
MSILDQAGQKAENLTPDEVSKSDAIIIFFFVIKITDQGYVTSHGDHYHYYN